MIWVVSRWRDVHTHNVSMTACVRGHMPIFSHSGSISNCYSTTCRSWGPFTIHQSTANETRVQYETWRQPTTYVWLWWRLTTELITSVTYVDDDGVGTNPSPTPTPTRRRMPGGLTKSLLTRAGTLEWVSEPWTHVSRCLHANIPTVRKGARWATEFWFFRKNYQYTNNLER
jgi:hypothetical protein